MDPADAVFISQGGFARMRELQRLLARQSIEAEILQPPGANTNA